MLLLATAAAARTYDALWTYDAPNEAYDGGALTPVGDVDDDGIPDLLVGSYADSRSRSYAGSVSLFSSAGALYATTPDWTFSGATENAQLAFGAALGDVNADGLPDFAAGAPYDSSGARYAGQVLAWYAGDGLSATPAWTYTDDDAGDGAGAGLAGAGDVDGDGDGELLVGANQAANTGLGRGWAGLFYGDPAGLPSEPDWTATGTTADGIFGEGAAGGGDLNGDGYADIAVGAPYESHALYYEGAVYVWYGGATGPGTDADAVVYGDSDLAYAGIALAFGDVDADGDADLVVGMSESSFAGYVGGSVVAYEGTPSGLDTAVAWQVGSSDGMSQFGGSLAVGDVTGDGADDVLVGASGWDGGGWNKGAAFLYLGSPTGLGSDDWSTTGTTANEAVGGGVAILGDVDADGFGDFAVGAAGHWSSTGGDGQVILYSGGIDDYDGDGVDFPDDCDDDDPAVFPGAVERCDGVDQDCDDAIDDDASDAGAWYPDADGDGYGDPSAPTVACQAPDGAIADATDCDDAAADVHPGAEEHIADGVDSDCDGDETCFLDADADGFAAEEGFASSADADCDDPGEAADPDPVDCDDTDADVHPGAPEPDDARDYDCDPTDDVVPGDDTAEDLGGGEDTGGDDATKGGCGCATGGRDAALGALLLAAGIVTRRHRA